MLCRMWQAQIHVTTGPIGGDTFEYRREICNRVKQANFGKAGISGAMVAMCQAASVSCQSGCKDVTHEAFDVFEKHCGYTEGAKQVMETLKKGQQYLILINHLHVQGIFLVDIQKIIGQYVKQQQECSKASAAGMTYIQQLGVNAAQALMLDKAGCGVRPKDPECTGLLEADEANKLYDCEPNCEKFPWQSVCDCDKPPYRPGCTECQKNPELESCKPNFCKDRPKHPHCVDTTTGSGGPDCDDEKNKYHPACQKRPKGNLFEEELDDLLELDDPQGEGAPPSSGLIAGASGGSSGLQGLGGSGGPSAGGKKKQSGERKMQSILGGL